MKRLSLSFLFFFTFVSAAYASDGMPSLFFSPEDVRQIETEIGSQRHDASSNAIHLDSILYFGPGKWRVWIEGEKWGPDTQKPHLRIIKVTSETVRLAYTPTGLSSGENEEKEITLRPHQNFDPATGVIAEGR